MVTKPRSIMQAKQLDHLQQRSHELRLIAQAKQLGHPWQRSHDRLRMQSSLAIRGNKPTINRARTQALNATIPPSSIILTLCNYRYIIIQRIICIDYMSKLPRSASMVPQSIVASLPWIAELLCVRDRLWACCHGWLRFGCAILEDCAQIQGLCARSLDYRKGSNLRFAQQNPRMVRIRTLHITYIFNYICYTT